MDLKGDQQLSGTPEQVYALLQDPEVLASIMPGCKELKRIAEDEYEGTIKARLGPISSQYKARFKISEKNPPHSYNLTIDGQGPGGFVNGNTRIELTSNDLGTVLNYTGKATIGGKIASVGQRLVESGAKIIIGQGFKALKKEVENNL
ncbi:MAG: carbon monoxide dehydrogenase subunit G [Rhodothermales bacterium]